MLEPDFTRLFCKKLELTGAKCKAIVASRMQPSGLPDRFVSSIQWQGWVEFKGVETRLKLIQADTIYHFHLRKAYSAIVARMKDPSGKVLSLRTVENSRLEKEFAVVYTALDFLNTLQRYSSNDSL